jgi:uncharacterized protein with NAD-binding domain and iron-sulfur cluster
MKSIVIFGAGIAGLSASHELIKLGYKVTVVEATAEPGGFFRSARTDVVKNMPTEYSWHGFGPWYHNAFDIMKEIPFKDKTIYDRALSRPIDFGLFPNDTPAQFFEGVQSIPKMFSMKKRESILWFYLMLKTWSANKRSHKKYSKINAAEAWRKILKDKSYRIWCSCFGPWIGSDWSNVSLHTTGEFFRKQLTTKPLHIHDADENGPAWSHGARDGWLLLKGPSSEYWFNPWIDFLKKKGVNFIWNKPLSKLNLQKNSIISAECDNEIIRADVFIIAINPFIFKAILGNSPGLENKGNLQKFKGLTKFKPHNQVSFRIAFSEPIKFPRERTAIVLSNSEFNLTLFAQEQAWDKTVSLGENVKSLWTGTSCISTNPGKLYNKPVENCTKEEFINEVTSQIYQCQSLNNLIKEANNKPLAEFKIISIEVWDEWSFNGDKVENPQPKWVNNSNNQKYIPEQKTEISNLLLAGAHTKTQADVWSIEGAVESGRRAAKEIDSRVKVISQYRPIIFKFLGQVDDLLFKIHLPHLLDLTLIVILAVVAVMLL